MRWGICLEGVSLSWMLRSLAVMPSRPGSQKLSAFSQATSPHCGVENPSPPHKLNGFAPGWSPISRCHDLIEVLGERMSKRP